MINETNPERRNEFEWSVVIPTYNRARYLPDAINSALQQDCDSLQILIIDDGSTDDTEQVLARFGDRITYVKQPNQGAATARNHGLRLARGRYISFLDSDDVWLPDKMSREREVFDTYEEVDAIGSDAESWQEGELLFERWPTFRQVESVTKVSYDPAYTIPAPTLTVTRQILDRMKHSRSGPFDSSMETHEDLDFIIRLFNVGQVYLLPQVLTRVRRFSDGTRPFDIGTSGELSLEVKRIKNHRYYSVLCRAQLLDWPAETLLAIRRVRAERARCATGLLERWSWPDIWQIIASELRMGALKNALAVLVSSLATAWGRRNGSMN